MDLVLRSDETTEKFQPEILKGRNLKTLLTLHFVVWIIYLFFTGALIYYFEPEKLVEIIEYRTFQLLGPCIFSSFVILSLYHLTVKYSKNRIHKLAGFILSIPISIIFQRYFFDASYPLVFGTEFELSEFKHILKSFTYYFYLFLTLNALAYIFEFWQKYKDQILKNKNLLEEQNSKEVEKSLDSKIFLSNRHIPQYIDFSSIKYIQADAYLSHIFTKENKKIALERSLKKWEDKLPNNQFYRIHRSVIVNTDYIHKIEKLPNQTYSVHITDCEEPLSMSRRYGKEFLSQPEIASNFNH